MMRRRLFFIVLSFTLVPFYQNCDGPGSSQSSGSSNERPPINIIPPPGSSGPACDCGFEYCSDLRCYTRQSEPTLRFIGGFQTAGECQNLCLKERKTHCTFAPDQPITAYNTIFYPTKDSQENIQLFTGVWEPPSGIPDPPDDYVGPCPLPSSKPGDTVCELVDLSIDGSVVVSKPFVMAVYPDNITHPYDPRILTLLHSCGKMVDDYSKQKLNGGNYYFVHMRVHWGTATWYHHCPIHGFVLGEKTPGWTGSKDSASPFFIGL